MLVIELIVVVNLIKFDVGDDLMFFGFDECLCWCVYVVWIVVSGNRIKLGVYWYGVKLGWGDVLLELIDKWICLLMKVYVVICNWEDVEYGCLLEILFFVGYWKKWVMFMLMLVGDGSEVCVVLFSEGLVYDLYDCSVILCYIVG